MPTHVVQQGDHVSALAERFGFHELKSIWDHPSNSALKEERKDPHILFPGDQLFVPEKEEKTVSVPTTKVHVFKVKIERLTIELRLQDVNSQPRTDVACKLDIDGMVTEETTDSDGKIIKKIPRSAKMGKLALTDLDIPLLIGYLDPVEEESGQIARLNNLGYDAGDLSTSDPDRFQSAVEEFQCDNDLKVDGICGSETQAKLTQVYGC